MEEKFVLWERFNPKLVENELIPKIEENCMKYGIFSKSAYDIFQQNKLAENSLYFHHSYAEDDIPIGRKYEAIALMDENWKIQPESIQKCRTKILCFFQRFQLRPSDYAMRGHHELSLIQFEGEIPSIIYELVEVTDLKQSGMFQKQIYLCSEAGLRILAQK